MAVAMIANHGQLEIVAHIVNHSATKDVIFIISFLLIVFHLLPKYIYNVLKFLYAFNLALKK